MVRGKNTFCSEDIKESTFNLNQSNNFENSTYHWTSELAFQHTGANLGIKEEGGANFLSSEASMLLIQQLKIIKSQNMDFGDVI